MTDTIEEVLRDADTAIDRWYIEQLEYNRECLIGPPTEPCGKPADWLQLCLVCDESVPCCNEHRAYLIEMDRLRGVKTFECGKCHAKRPRLAELVEFLPIGRNQ